MACGIDTEELEIPTVPSISFATHGRPTDTMRNAEHAEHLLSWPILLVAPESPLIRHSVVTIMLISRG